jgi:hypothetical protein
MISVSLRYSLPKADLKSAMGSHFDAVSKLIPKLVNEHVEQLLLDFKSNSPDKSEEDVKVEQRRLEVEVYLLRNGISFGYTVCFF